MLGMAGQAVAPRGWARHGMAWAQTCGGAR